MKKVAISILLMAVWLSACGKSGSSTEHSSHSGTAGSTDNGAWRYRRNGS
ncbi:hypothetical protein [Paenibacillus qinlingensis]|nr:hypothetical protein [Paenibacillus qinlingensis]NQX60017.1 hypothetical protein [Paenibacillus qinlingensis]